MKSVLLALLAWTAASQECNVLDKSDPIPGFETFTFAQADIDAVLKIITPAKVTSEGLVFNYSESASAAWITKKERISDGFMSEFDFTVKDQADGLAFIVQTDRLVNTVSGGGHAVGFGGSFASKAVAAFVDLCYNRNTPADPCEQYVCVAEMNGAASQETCSAIPTGSVITLDGSVNQGKVAYLNSTNQMQFYLGTSIVHSLTLSTSLEAILGSRFSWFGFSSSSSASGVQSLVNVETFKFSQQPSDTSVVSTVTDSVEWGASVFFNVVQRDSCQKPAVSIRPGAELTKAYLLRANDGIYSAPTPRVNGSDILYPQSVTISGGSWVLRFDIPPGIAATWDFDAAVDNVEPEGIPLVSAVVSIEPPVPEGIQAWGLALLIILIVLVLVGGIYASYRLHRYRKKLKENEADIEAGKEKHKLDILDREVDYQVNPMLGSLDDMKKRLAENMAELERLRGGKGDALDHKYTIEQLKEQNDRLRDEMNNLKKEAQQEEASKTNFRKTGLAAKGGKRREFDQQSI